MVSEENYSITAFHYIHQNPVMADLVKDVEDWPYSSFCDYAKIRNGKLCNLIRAMEIPGLTDLDIKIGSDKEIKDDLIKRIYL